ncbi:MAG: acyltransferase domain-containing protein [Lachnospiraceae bacterium]|nr:acyltransferase domain-containing protein [Lachnospiraceae bacterium]
MKITELFQMIDLQPEMIEKLGALSFQIDIKKIDGYLNRMMDITTAQEAYKELKEYLNEDANQMQMLFCQLKCAGRVYDKYQSMGIPDSVFAATMKCFKRFLDECAVKTGRSYFDRGWWTYRQISMRIFRIGDLEYELKEYDGEKVIAIHIPSDAIFSGDMVDDSFRRAEVFFKTYFPEYTDTKYICNSWLLSPELKPLLSNQSHILDFQRRFEIVKVNKEDYGYIEWLFQKPEDTAYEKLPEHTSLQRKVKRLLLEGESIGSAYGIMKL